MQSRSVPGEYSAPTLSALRCSLRTEQQPVSTPFVLLTEFLYLPARKEVVPPDPDRPSRCAIIDTYPKCCTGGATQRKEKSVCLRSEPCLGGQAWR